MPKLHLVRSGYLPGAVSALLASVAMIVLGRIWDAPVAPQLLSDRLTALVPLRVFAALLGQFESSAKPLTFVLILAGQLLVGALVGALLAALLRRGVLPRSLFWMTLAATWVVLVFVLAPLGGIGIFGMDSVAGPNKTVISSLIIAAIFAGALMLWLGAQSGAIAYDPLRRTVLKTALIGVPVAFGVAYLGRFFIGLSEKSQVAAAPNTPDGISPPITSASDFYVVSKNFVDPSVGLSTWQLKIDGLVNTPRTYTYDELRQRPAKKHIATLECISNEVGGEYISNGEWSGFPLKTLLDEVGVKPGVVDVVFYAVDDYSDSIPLNAALDPNTFMVFELDGEVLPPEHGYPVRMLVPNIYGMKNVKWLNRISLVDYDYKGYWQHRDWSDIAIVNTMSRIDFPVYRTKITVGDPIKVGGIAFAGNRGISRVEVSFDSRKTWHQAKLEPPLSPLSWVRWSYMWTPPEAGKASIIVRAADGTGQMQTDQESPPLPDGATGYHLIHVKVDAPTT